MGGGGWPSSRTESSSSSRRPRTGVGISGCRLTLVGWQDSAQGKAQRSLCAPMTDHHFLLVIPWGSPELLGLGVQGAQAEVAPDWLPNRNQLPLHRHQRVL